MKGRGRGRPRPLAKNGSGKNAVAKAGPGAAPAGARAVRKSAVTLLITEHADRVREALNRTIDALAGIEPNDREALVRGERGGGRREPQAARRVQRRARRELTIRERETTKS